MTPVRKKRRPRRVPVLVAAAACLLLPAQIVHAGERPGGGMRVWVEPAMHRVFPGDLPKVGRTARLAAARNESEAFQLVVRGQGVPLRGVDVRAGDLAGPGGAVIPASALTLYREIYVRVDQPSFLGGVPGNPRRPGEYPDPLLPFRDPYDPARPPAGAPFDAEPDRNQPVWVEVRVPADAVPGTYVGSLAVTALDRDPVPVGVQLRVWAFAIPRERSVSTAYGLSHDSVLLYHGGPDGAWDAQSLEVLRAYENVLHEHRLDTTRLPLDRHPFRFDDAGNLLPVDWRAYDAVAGPRMDGSYYDDGIGLRRTHAGYFRPGVTGDLEGELADEQYRQAAAAFAAHLKEMGWMDRVYVYVRDEPYLHEGSHDRIVDDVRLMLEADPDWAGRFLATNWYMEKLEGVIDIWVPDSSKYGPSFLGFLGIVFPGRQEYARQTALGKELWFYVCNCTVPPYAGYDIDTRLGYEPRILLWGAWFEGASGFLYWRANRWVREAPWTRLMDPEAYPLVARNGDGFILYPGDHHGTAAPAGSPPGISLDGPVPTIRLKATRDGLEDWEMFLLAGRRVGREKVMEIVSRAYRGFGTFPLPPVCDPLHPTWTRCPRVMRSVRQEVGDLLDAQGSP